MYTLIEQDDPFAHFKHKLNFTETVYNQMQTQFISLRNGKPDLTWEEMWEYFDQLHDCDNLKKHEKTLLLYDHLFIFLKFEGNNRFLKLSDDFGKNIQKEE